MPIFVQYIFATVVNRIFKHLGWSRVECRIDTSHLPTVISTSGILEIRLSSVSINCKFCSIPVCGMLVGIKRNEPSFRLGINSSPMPGKRSLEACQKVVCLKSLPAYGFKPFGDKTECCIESQPYHNTKEYRNQRYKHKFPTMFQAPT